MHLTGGGWTASKTGKKSGTQANRYSSEMIVGGVVCGLLTGGGLPSEPPPRALPGSSRHVIFRARVTKWFCDSRRWSLSYHFINPLARWRLASTRSCACNEALHSSALHV
mmetsp:Transcript_83793/g.269960  ORF Transcript_83793/g.269960 Transcript_83793/m.269960 type:complete len:110 (+) Transcript_83793:2318-2647(+)